MAEKQKILIADDEAGITDVFSSVLKLDNFEVVTAADGEECLTKARASTFDLILLDVYMPKLDGFEVIKQLKQIPHLKHTHIIILSGYSTTPENIESGYRLGVTEYWKKPMAVEEFEARVRAILRIAETEKKLRELEQIFTAMIVHDLRGPLSGIVGLAELLSEGDAKFSPEEATMMKSVGSASRLMLNIVNDFLEITHQESSEQTLYQVPLKLNDVIERAVSNCSALQREKSVDVTMDIGKLPSINADPGRLEVAFNQLIDNSIRFTPDHGSISISCKAEPTSIIVAISHTGQGVTPADIPMLFDKMRITMPGLRRPGGQTGLGLPICRGIIEAHGGTISAQSQKGKGTTFTITLPLTSL